MRRRSRLPRSSLVAAGPVVLVATGIAGYLSFGYSPWAAVAMTLLTLTTVGFASTNLPTSVLVFTAGLALLGVSVFVVIVGLAASAIVEGRVGVLSRSRRIRQRMSDLDRLTSCAPTAGSAGRSPGNWKPRACRSWSWTANQAWNPTWNETACAT